MKLSKTIALVITACSMNTFAENATEIKFNALSMQVQKTVLQQANRNSIKKVELIKEEGTTTYEIETNTNGAQKDIVVTEKGNILEIEQSTSLIKLSLQAQAAVKKDYPDLKINEIETVQSFYTAIEGTAEGKKVAFKVLASGDIEDNGSTEQKD